MFAEKTVELILKKAEKAGIECRVIPSPSFVDAVAAELSLLSGEEMIVLDALQPDKLQDFPDRHILVIQAYNRQIASRVNWHLICFIPITPCNSCKGGRFAAGKRIITVPLYKMDRLPFIDHLTTFYLPPVFAHGPAALLNIMSILRGEDGCPWDREQDHNTLRPYLLEEAYEVLGAIKTAARKNCVRNWGTYAAADCFSQPDRQGERKFSFYDVVAGITENYCAATPMCLTSPAKTAEEVNSTWQIIKKAKRKRQKHAVHTGKLPARLAAGTETAAAGIQRGF
jgi:tetrapyrrole methylase family protein / MazG family protein